MWRPTQRGVRISLAFLLTPLVPAAIFVASAVSEGLPQDFVLVFATLGLVLAVSAVALPPDAQGDYAWLKSVVSNNRTWTAVALVLLAGIGVVFFERVAREWVPGKSWAGLAVQASLALWVFGVVAYLSRRLVSPRPGISGLVGLVDAIVVVAAPIVLLRFIYRGPLEIWEALGILIVFPAALFAVFLILRVVERRAASGPAPPPPGALAVVGVACAILSSVLLLGAAIRVPIERRLLENSQVAERGPLLSSVTLENPAAPSAADKRSLFLRFAPVLRLHEHEAWTAYAASTSHELIEPAPDESCSQRRTRPCNVADLEGVLDRISAPHVHPPPRERVFAGGHVYPRFVAAGEEIDDLGDSVPRFARRTEWLLQYWLFYPYNGWTGRTAIGPLIQNHGGDWEWVGVGLDGTGVPVFVAYSAHCAGSWRPWTEVASVALTEDRRRVLVGGSSDLPASHPLVTVAGGSHANYPTPGTREPDWGSCRFKRLARAVRWLTFAVAAREETPELGPIQIPDVLPEEQTLIDAQRAVWWGSDGRQQLWRIQLGDDEHGPPSPSYQSAWKDPIRTIFASGWECDAGDVCP